VQQAAPFCGLAGGAAGAPVGEGVTNVSMCGVWPAANEPGPDGVLSVLQKHNSQIRFAPALLVVPRHACHRGGGWQEFQRTTQRLLAQVSALAARGNRQHVQLVALHLPAAWGCW
jgi:hypothetical protein